MTIATPSTTDFALNRTKFKYCCPRKPSQRAHERGRRVLVSMPRPRQLQAFESAKLQLPWLQAPEHSSLKLSQLAPFGFLATQT
jgi:hypothetical protein